MADINKFIGDASEYSSAKEHLAELDDWNEDIALAEAGKIGVEMTEARWEVVRFLRLQYIEHGAAKARTLTALLDERFADRGGRRYLYTLFPGGPIAQASAIAGLPVPEDATDPSFGYSQ